MKAILTYHSIDDTGSVLSVDEQSFRRQMEWLARSRLRVLPLAQLIQDRVGDAVALTFDDAFVNFASAAWPVLRAHGFAVTLFVVTDRAGGSNDWPANGGPAVPRLPLLDWSRLERLAAQGVTIGSHTRTHPDLRMLADAQMEDEVAAAADLVRARTGCAAPAFAYPYGAFDDRVIETVRRTHDLACTTDLRSMSRNEDPLRLPRLDTYYLRRPGLLERFGTDGFRRYIWLRASGRRLRQAISGSASQ